MTQLFLFVAFACNIVLANLLDSKDFESRPQSNSRIVGGNYVDISEYPYQLSVQNDGYHYCGASVVAARWALTAGHCCYGYDVLSLSIRGGSSTQNVGGVLFTVNKMVVHTSYDPDNLNFDVCMLKINETFIGHPNIALLPLSKSISIPANQYGIVSGWGATVTDGDSIEKLRATNVKILSERSCTSRTRNYVSTTNSMFCAGNLGNTICVGDSGGPLVFNRQQIGIVSFIIMDCGGTTPAVYTRISNKSVTDFIQLQIKSNR